MGRLLSKLFAPRPALPLRSERVVVITGCDSGFGHELALLLDTAGYVVVATCLTDDGQRVLAGKLRNPRAVVVGKSDVTKEESVAELARVVEQAFPQGIWCLVNNAGVYGMSLVELAPLSQYRRMMEVNFFGVVAVTKALLPSLRRSRGRVVQLSSIAGTSGFTDLSAYCASKFALDAFSDSLRREMLPFGVDVVLVKPYYSKTNLMNNAFAERDRLYNAAPDSIKGAYDQAFMDHTRQEHAKQFDTAIDPAVVIKVLFQAVDAARPAAHIPVGLMSHALYWLEYLVPTRIADYVVWAGQGFPMPKSTAGPAHV